MSPENEPQLEINLFPPQLRGGRNFGRTLQLIAHGETRIAVAENWSTVCQSLQEKIQHLSGEAEFNLEAYQTELAHRRHDLEYLDSLTTNYQLLADELDSLKVRESQMEKTIRNLLAENKRLKGFYYIRDWQCKESWREIQRLDPSRSAACPTVIEDSLIVPPQPPDSEYIPPKKKLKEEEV